MNVQELEWQTRMRLVDPKLEAQGWTVARFRDGVPLNSYERQSLACPDISFSMRWTLFTRQRTL